ncbi:two-component regulator propeller domain-containing protein [Labilibaculum sp. K2S]|uniref:hybrid sensor histidine kinase/response regulator transcription factor n=1 Tax=Labilibaculum sp. K2S TaxID=3056386 RepID=UPI0025A44393|nr:hybrid sensor histidine kinase/response regulator transcription factor [Labilibaculum sp. K2S]MDM8160001.1 two-component regulator propeller domain-containing protein [Labilibaculum sp. K2S]
MRRIARLLSIILAYTISLNVVGQPSYIFHHLNTNDGLSNSNVMSILKDSYGFLWVGTGYGLNRYDGYGFKVYLKNKDISNSLSDNEILDLQEDGLGNIWIKTKFNYMVYDRKKDCFINDIGDFLKNFGIEVDRNYLVHVDKNEDLWVLSNQKVFFYDTHKNELNVFAMKVQVDEVITSDFSDDGESLYGNCNNGIIWQINKRTGNQEVLEVNNAFGSGDSDYFNKIFVDDHRGIWLFSRKNDQMLYRKSEQSDWKILKLHSSVETRSNGVLRLMDDGNGRIWVGTDHKGVFIYDQVNNQMTNLLSEDKTSFSIASNNVGCLYKDKSGIIWLGHNKKGISFYHDSFRKFYNVEYAECEDVSVVLEDRMGNVWLGTDGKGLYVSRNVSESSVEKLPIENSSIVSLLEDKNGRIWVGTYLSGLYCIEGDKIKHYTNANSKLASDDIWCLKEDRYGAIWIASLNGGIQCLKVDNDSFDSLILVSEEIKYPLDMFYDGGDKLYVGTVNGMYIIDITNGDQELHQQNRRGTQQLKEIVINNVYIDRLGNIWLGNSQGLTIWDMKNDSLHYLNKESGLCDNIIRGIVEDDQNKIWVTTSNGLSVLSTERDAYGELKISNRNYSTKDGISTNYFNNHAICKLSNGDILLGETQGYTIINPNKLAETYLANTKVFLTGLSVGNNNIMVDSLYNGRRILNKSIELTDTVTFSYKDMLLSFHFTTGDLINADKVKYEYKLEGFSSQWIDTHENRIVFSSLNPGEYKLFIKACNSNGVWSNQVTTLNINVTPPFYLSWIGKTLSIIVLLTLISYIFYRNRKRNNLKFEYKQMLMKQEQEKILNDMKLRFFTNVSHDLRTPLTLITTPLQTILNEELDAGLRKKLQVIYKNAEQLFSLINSLLDFRKLDVGGEVLNLQLGDFVNFVRDVCIPFNSHAVDRNIQFSFSNEIENLTMQFDPVKVHKIMLNILSNAFKYTPDGGEISVGIYQEDDNVCIRVSDSGSGISDAEKKHVFERFYQTSQKQEKTGSGIGLHIVSEYVRLHDGIITISDNQLQGSVFTIQLPIQKIDCDNELNILEDISDDAIDKMEIQQSPIKPSLLFVDDNKDLCEIMADSLQVEYNVLIAYNGAEALEKLENNDIKIVVSDVMMPVMNGTELCNRIKTNIQWSHIPVILLTARTTEEYKIEGFELGADDYITKPFNFDILKLRISKWLEWTERCHVSFSQKVDVSPSEITITSLDEQLIEKAIKVVEEHINDTEFSVEALGSDVGLSRSHLYKKLMSITGKGPAEFIRTIRLKRGRQLLEKSQLQISEIAYEVGFNSPKRFAINFKCEFGVTPSEYQRSYKEKE